MRCRTLCRLLTLTALTLPTMVIAFAQPTPSASGKVLSSSLVDSLHYDQPPGGKLLIVTLAQPNHRQNCAVRSLTATELMCKGPFDRTRIYKSSDIAALIVPGDLDFKIRFVLAFNAALGASIWGTVVLAATCPGCAAATGIAALFFFCGSGAVLIGDDVPDSLLYLVPGETLRVKLRY